MNEPELHVVIQTPRQTLLAFDATSMRVPTLSGQVGLRPRVEPTVLAVEPGLMLLSHGDVLRYVGTAGGLLHCDGRQVNVLTPLAVSAQTADAVVKELEAAMAEPDEEAEARAMLGRLETSILRELRSQSQRAAPGPGGRR